MPIVKSLPYAAALLAAVSALAGLLGLGPLPSALFAAAAAVLALLGALGQRGGADSPRGGARESEAAASAAAAAALAKADEETRTAGRAAAEARSAAERAALELSGEREAARGKALAALLGLRFADAVIAKVPVKTEEAAFALMGRLVALRDQSAKAAEAALSSESDSLSADNVSSLATGARGTIASVRSTLAEMRKRDRDSAKGLAALGAELKSGMELLSGIEEITERSRLIAFNMAIEAARIGEKGRGFRVIVGELRALNDRTVDFSKQVAELLGRFKKYNESLVQTAIENTARVADEVERGIRDEETAIESLLKASTSCVDLSSNVTRSVQSMNLELDGVLESLQFQDITRQMIEGALATIAEAESELAPLAGRPEGGAAREDGRRRMEELRAKLLARAKTKGEKEAIQEVKA